jgi:hypothetical protein
LLFGKKTVFPLPLGLILNNTFRPGLCIHGGKMHLNTFFGDLQAMLATIDENKSSFGYHWEISET